MSHHLSRLLLAALLPMTLLPALAQTGVLLPGDKDTPDPKVLSLEEMTVDITIDDGDARIFMTQIFLNHTGLAQEGVYRFPLPSEATVSDFAVWDGAVRIPAVVLERKRAQEVYAEAKAQAIDPGLLQMGERSGADPAERTLFTAKIVPIPAWGTKRLELEYHQRLEATALAQGFVLPIKPDAAGTQSVHHFHAHMVIHSSHPLSKLALTGGYGFKIAQQDDHGLTADLAAENLSLGEDMGAAWTFASSGTDALTVITHRDPAPPAPQVDETSPRPPAGPEPGFFQASALLADSAASSGTAPVGPPRNIVVLFDTSLSMQWEKLERSYAATEALLHTLTPADHFNLILFNQQTQRWQKQPVSADAKHVNEALDFLRASHLRGGTDLGLALHDGLAQCTQPNSSLVLFSDGGSDLGDTILTSRIAANYTKQWKAMKQPPHTDVFAVGDDAKLGLLQLLAKNGGFLEHTLSTEPLDLHLRAFLAKLTRAPVTGLAFDVSPNAAVQMVYPLESSVYPGSTATWVGQYARPSSVTMDAHGSRDGKIFTLHASAELPAAEPAHLQLPRLWAQARVDALLEQINRDGESRAAIDEIIRLARRYKLVTPYTSFLAVPRSLLRPRVIRPGDPVLRVRTDPAITSVVAIFPFGLTKELRHLAGEDTPDRDGTGGLAWETRFLAPEDMRDGTYDVRLILRDGSGNTYRENKSFVIASTPPTVKVLLASNRLHRGETVLLRANASQSTRTLTARLPGALPVTLRWSPQLATNAARLTVPADMPLGTYKLTVTAEDVAHNLGTQEVTVDVVP
ncbi:Ca-activated chloride channel family protein [Bryocella elongata]|uniref:Ca-activated chloride channel family protein n=1 Tax=Bryocella elongata TaxID=863522 RepID=A0A1H6CC05_9BACT|nr:VIT domain-containing protein [Bryocella elongata]SEG70297.1 Ca-activated chloride channel family protein [Bryocella elongata]